MPAHHVANGRKGGLVGGATVRERYGVEYLRELGRRGGRLGGRPTWEAELAAELPQERHTMKRRRTTPIPSR